MQFAPDAQLLRDYAEHGDEAAFAELVGRHSDLVYAAAMRQVGLPDIAAEIAQGAFISLARGAAKLAPRLASDASLAGWLYRTARNLSLNHRRGEFRRQTREQRAMEQLEANPEATPETADLRRVLDDVLSELPDADAEAIVLRFFENLDFRSVGRALGVSDDAAQKRVSRALEKLRERLARRGIQTTAGALALGLAAFAAPAAPVGLTAAITSAVGQAGTSLTASAAAPAVAAVTLQKAGLAAVSVALLGAAISGGLALRPATPAHASAPSLAAGSPPAPGPIPVTVAPAPVRDPLTRTTMFSLLSPPGSVALQPDGKILVGSVLFGAFVDEQTGQLGLYNRLVMRLNPDGSLDRTFLSDSSRSDSSSFVAGLDVGSDGRILVTGSFSAVENEPRPGFAVLNTDGALDTSFVPWRGHTNAPGRGYIPGGVNPAVWLSNGTVAVVTDSLEGPRPRYPTTVYQLDATGAWIVPTNPLVGGEFLRPSGLIRTLGESGFWARQPVEWSRATPNPTMPPSDIPFAPRPFLPTAWDAAKVLRALFEEVPIALCRYAVPLPDGGTLLAVQDQGRSGEPATLGRFMRFDKEWRPDFTFTNHFDTDARSRPTIVRQPDGRLLVAGLVGRINGEESAGVVRLLEDGRMDPMFRCAITNAIEGRVVDLAVQADGKIVICGFFSEVNGIEVPHLARLNPNGSLDPTFRPPFMTHNQFQRERMAGGVTVPVARLSDAAANATSAAPATAPKPIVITSLTKPGEVAALQYVGEPGQAYILQAKDGLADPQWLNLSTNKASRAGHGTFYDPEAGKHPRRFYRIAQP